jgi:Transcriptional regulator
MKLEQLLYLREICKCKSITDASKNLYISQPALSKAITLLEQDLGITLLTRTVTGTHLTQEGERLMPIITDIINEVDNLLAKSVEINEEIKNETNKIIKGKFTVYTVPNIMDTFLYKALKMMEEHFPLVQITPNLIEASEAQFLPVGCFNDIIILVNLNNNLGEVIQSLNLNYEVLFSDKLCVVVNNASPLTKIKTISIEQVMNYELIFSYNRFDQKTNYMRFANRTKPIKMLMKTNNVKVIMEELSRNQKAVYITHSMLSKKDFNNGGFATIPIKNIKCEFFCLYNTESPNMPIIREFFKLLRYARNEIYQT